MFMFIFAGRGAASCENGIKMGEDSRGAVDEAINDPVRKASQYCKKAQSRACSQNNFYLGIFRESHCASDKNCYRCNDNQQASHAKPNHFPVVLHERSYANTDTSALKYRKKPAMQ